MNLYTNEERTTQNATCYCKVFWLFGANKHLFFLFLNLQKYPLTNALLQGDLGDDAEVSSFGHTVGHVEVEALGDGDLTLGLLVLPATVVLLWTANSLHSDVGVPVAALGLAEVGKHQASLHARWNRDQPRDGGVRLHSYRPTRSSQEDGDVSLRRYSEYVSF